jgi:ribosomal protein L16
MKYRLYTRVSANIPVYTKGNETRMGKGKGGFDYWAARVPVSRIIFEVKGEVHERVVRDAFRIAANKMPGKFSRSLSS